jgi:hypothetical protein
VILVNCELGDEIDGRGVTSTIISPSVYSGDRRLGIVSVSLHTLGSEADTTLRQHRLSEKHHIIILCLDMAHPSHEAAEGHSHSHSHPLFRIFPPLLGD